MLASTPSLGVQLSVYLMISGALVAALNDLAFNIEGWEGDRQTDKTDREALDRQTADRQADQQLE